MALSYPGHSFWEWNRRRHHRSENTVRSVRMGAFPGRASSDVCVFIYREWLFVLGLQGGPEKEIIYSASHPVDHCHLDRVDSGCVLDLSLPARAAVAIDEPHLGVVVFDSGVFRKECLALSLGFFCRSDEVVIEGLFFLGRNS